ncbi:hypothetical protein MASR2M39_32600 [Ignavibacteriales bacterium]
MTTGIKRKFAAGLKYIERPRNTAATANKSRLCSVKYLIKKRKKRSIRGTNKFSLNNVWV